MAIIDKKRIKESWIGRILYFARELYRCPDMVTICMKLRKSKGAAVILLGTPTFNNLGDHLIATAAMQLLEDCYPEKQIVEIPTQAFLRYRDKLMQVVTKEIPIFITGGGWMGSLWPEDEARMQLMIASFAGNRIVVLPQTIFYNLETEAARELLSSALHTYKECRDLTICTREDNSHKFAQEHFTGAKVKTVLAPDIALYFRANSNAVRKGGITFCLRRDREKITKPLVEEWGEHYCISHGIEQSITDTVQKRAIPKRLREKKIACKIKEFQRSKIVITDRLHGMIFSVISNTNCIAFNNKTGKVKGVYQRWLADNPRVAFLPIGSEKESFEHAVDDLINSEGSLESWSRRISQEFDRLITILRGVEMDETEEDGYGVDPQL